MIIKENSKKYVHNQAMIKRSMKTAFTQKDKEIFEKNIKELTKR